MGATTTINVSTLSGHAPTHETRNITERLLSAWSPDEQRQVRGVIPLSFVATVRTPAPVVRPCPARARVRSRLSVPKPCARAQLEAVRPCARRLSVPNPCALRHTVLHKPVERLEPQGRTQSDSADASKRRAAELLGACLSMLLFILCLRIPMRRSACGSVCDRGPHWWLSWPAGGLPGPPASGVGAFAAHRSTSPGRACVVGFGP
ncbi:hypothetical protein JB92DRAFT_1149603 [Gautieria morchelliformis]|nr:hypothetical protein JB92DRAFT_1149603 [Gautieria morchelliformis]